jgi:hypothetical protein
MRAAPFFFFSIIFFFISVECCYSQAEIVITNPDGLNNLWVKVPDNGTVKEGEVDLVGNTQPECAGLALKRFKRNLNNLGLIKSLKDVASGGFTVLGLVVPGGYAKYAFTALKMTYKAMSAESAEEFETEAVKETIKQIGGAKIEIKDSKVLEKALKESFKKIIDGLFKSAKKDLYNKPLSISPCKNGSVKISLEPVEGDPAMKFILSYVMDEECDCLYPDQNVSGSVQKLKKYSVWGSMPVTVTNIEFEEVRFHIAGRKDKIKLTMEYGTPEFHVSAECDCGDVSYSSPDEMFAGASIILEDGNFTISGVNVAYSHPLKNHIGMTYDAGIYFGKNGSQDITKFQVLAGVSYLSNTGKFNFSPHLLAGIARITSKYTNSKSSITALSVAAGTDINYPLTSKLAIAARADLNPVIKNGTSVNFRLSAGVKLHL